jgi:hypothetical protein
MTLATKPLRQRAVSLAALLVVLAAFAFAVASAPQAHAAGGKTVSPLYVRCSTTYTDTSGYSTFSPGTSDLDHILAWMQVKHDNSDGTVCAVRAKTQWFAGYAGYNGASNHEYVAVCYTNGSGCPGGTFGLTVGSGNIAAYGNAFFYSGWISTTCPTYGVAVKTYGNNTPVYVGFAASCISI